MKTKKEKRNIKRDKKLKERRQKLDHAAKREKADFLFHEATWYWNKGKLKKALSLVERALRLEPANEEYVSALAGLGHEMERPDVELKALLKLNSMGLLPVEMMPKLCILLRMDKKYEQALDLINETLPLIPAMKIRNKKTLKASLTYEQRYCRFQIEAAENIRGKKRKRDTLPSPGQTPEQKKPPAAKPSSAAASSVPSTAGAHLPEIDISVELDARAFEKVFVNGAFTSPERYELALEAQKIRFRETFENLVSLHSLREVRSFWYQEETVRKILKGFRGRALLADEVGLGKTIEALMALKEYIQRGMVKSALILTPTPLVSQWQEELRSKFDLEFPTTNDPDYRTDEASFWKRPFILSSINIAKSKRNFPFVTEREYDMVIVDEAHHLKNRNTLNWKLVNTLKKRFLLLLTATPVENNLMEIYNLVTLLKPGQLKTASDFRREFMTRGDPTDPRNRDRLRELLGQVMIRNTRALARVDIPPRFARTIRVTPLPVELDIYERISALVKDIAATDGYGQRLLLKTLLEEAGSSPRAVSLTLERMLDKGDPLLAHERDIRAIHDMCRSLDESSKDTRLLEIIRESPAKKIIFVKYLGTLQHVSEFLAQHEIPHALFHGGLDNRVKEEQIRRFREEEDILLTTEIGGEGRNLQFCHRMINYDLPWNPMKIEQRIGRLHRIGQENEVIIDNLCAAGSIEDYILDLLDKKINMFEMVIGEIDMILGRIEGERDFSDTIYEIWLASGPGGDREKAFNRLGSRLKKAKTSYEKTKSLDEKLFGEDYEL
ncbi:MAG: DEAD/DEAH box helicase family protein [Deltaproteobacteria bacterium]|nr:DEAD/DEAH box helicase family protein [Deltaproteobacteria bacterium]